MSLQEVGISFLQCKATLLKSHFGMGILLKVCSVFSEHIFPGTPLGGCFCQF